MKTNLMLAFLSKKVICTCIHLLGNHYSSTIYIYILIESNDCVANRIDEYESMVNLAVHWFIKTLSIKVAFSINNVINKSQWF